MLKLIAIDLDGTLLNNKKKITQENLSFINKLIHIGYEVVIADDLSNSQESVLGQIEEIVGKKIPFEQIDLCCRKKVTRLFETYKIDAVINFAGFKAVGESVQKPIEYYTNNISGALNLLDVMRKHNVKNSC